MQASRPAPAKQVLIAGIEGGSDIVCAYALSTLVQGAGAVAWANTKRHHSVGPGVPLPGKRHVFRVSEWRPEPGKADVHGTDHLVPRGHGGCPLLAVLRATRLRPRR